MLSLIVLSSSTVIVWLVVVARGTAVDVAGVNLVLVADALVVKVTSLIDNHLEVKVRVILTLDVALGLRPSSTRMETFRASWRTVSGMYR